MRLHLSLLVAAAASAQELALTRVAAGLSSPIDIQNAGDGSGRLFFAQQNGIVRTWRNGALAAAPFLDIRSKTRMSGECGLLGLAFPPDFARKRHFYVNYTNPGCTESTVARYRLSSDDAADPASEQIILTVAQPFQNHNGGCLQFGRDGFLYAAFGDGGSGGDPRNLAQNKQSRLGKILRIDVESGGDGFRVPESNPFVGDRQYLPEIWALGLRNPWRFSFDRETGDLWMGDVGQDRAEEVDFQPASSRGGENYGWRIYEGLRCFSGDCATPDLTAPVHEYTRQQGDVSVTGGYVARGPGAGGLRGDYLYADFASGRIWALRRAGSGWQNRLLLDSSFNVSSFGEDEAGDLHLADHSGGGIYRVEGSSRPALTSESVVNAASGEPGLVAGSLASIFASNITAGPGIAAAQSLPLPTTLDGVRVSIGGRAAPILAVANVGGREQVNVQVPWEAAGSAPVVVTRGESASAAVAVAVAAVQPGIFESEGAGIVVRASGNTLVTGANPLRRGEAVYFYATGLGAVDNPPATGSASPAQPLATVRGTVAASVGGLPASVQFAGLAPGFAGVYQLNIVPDAGTPAGSQDLVVSVNGTSGRPVKVAVQ